MILVHTRSYVKKILENKWLEIIMVSWSGLGKFKIQNFEKFYLFHIFVLSLPVFCLNWSKIYFLDFMTYHYALCYAPKLRAPSNKRPP